MPFQIEAMFLARSNYVNAQHDLLTRSIGRRVGACQSLRGAAHRGCGVPQSWIFESA